MTTENPRTVQITGCSTGIGYTCAHGLKERGYRVFASARKREDVARLADEGLQALQLDLDDPASIEEAVLKKLIHALESPRPRPRYYVTVPTYLLGDLRRILTSRGLDRVLRRASGSGAR